MRAFTRHLSGIDKFLALGLTGLGSVVMYHYVKWDEIKRMTTIKTVENEIEKMFLKITESSIPLSPVYNVNLNRSKLEYEYAQFILDSTIHQIKSVITVATAPKNSGKSTIFIRAAQIIADCIKNQENNKININWDTLKRFEDVHVVYLNLEQGLRTALKLQFGINSESELEALSLLNIILDITIKENKCILLLFDSVSYVNHDNKLKNKFCRMLKHLIDSGYCYIFCLSSSQGINTFNHDTLNNGRKYIFEDDRFLLNVKEKKSLIGACYNYDGNCIYIDSDVDKLNNNIIDKDIDIDTIHELYQEMEDENEVKSGIIGELLSYLNQSYSVQNQLISSNDASV